MKEIQLISIERELRQIARRKKRSQFREILKETLIPGVAIGICLLGGWAILSALIVALP